MNFGLNPLVPGPDNGRRRPVAGPEKDPAIHQQGSSGVKWLLIGLM
jgi:hypothetical protein